MLYKLMKIYVSKHQREQTEREILGGFKSATN